MIYKLIGKPQHYIWGGKNYIPALFDLDNKQQQYYAEWWLGAHPSAPSMLEINHQLQPLNHFLKQNSTALGKQSQAQFGDELPFLLKILDVVQPLSIQLHPTKKQAEIGFEAENQKGIDLSSPKRTYKDNNHKPEMMIALSEFWLLHGFKTKEKIIQTLTERPSLQNLAKQLEKQDLHSFYADIMQAEQNQLEAWLCPILQQHQAAYEQGELNPDNPDYWVLYSIEAMEIPQEKLDAGLICFYLFNIVHLHIGEGIYQDAGIPHAYLRGQNIELMACSDNVIRGGLTPKYVDIPELLKVIDTTEIEPQIIPTAPNSAKTFTYHTPAKDFALENLCYSKGDYINGKMQNAGILLVMDGEVKIQSETTALSLKKGESVFITDKTEYQIEGIKDGYAVLAKLPE